VKAETRRAEYNGVLLVDKEPGPTSHDVVAACRKILGEKRIGHLGTLDPIAGGLLPLAVGQATRLTRFFLMQRKSYRGAIELGYATDTYDRAGQPTSERAAAIPSAEEVVRESKHFLGRIKHSIPPFSARKVGGKKLYEFARQGETVATEPKEVEVYAFDIEKVVGSMVEFFVDCSTGTYVRSLAHELGQKLGCGAHLHSLRRTQVGEFLIEKAVTTEQLRAAQSEGRVPELLISMANLLTTYDSVTLTAADLREITHGKDILRKVDPIPKSRFLKLMSSDGKTLVAIGEMVDRHSVIITIHPAVVLAHS